MSARRSSTTSDAASNESAASVFIKSSGAEAVPQPHKTTAMAKTAGKSITLIVALSS